MARFFIVTINYAPEPSGFAPHATQLAEYLARRGHDVSVFTGFPFTPAWRRRDDDRGRLFATERRGGATVHRLTHFIPRRPSSAVQRIAMEACCGTPAAAAMLAAVARRRLRPDAMLYIGAQPAAAMAARIVAWLIRRPYYVRITDLAAEAALDVGMIGGRLSRALQRFEYAAYGKAAGASVLCGSFEGTLVRHGYPVGRVHVMPNPINTRLIRPVPRTLAFRRMHAIPDDAFVFLHAGSMGRKQALSTVVAAAARLRDTSICWAFVGDGDTREALESEARAAAVNACVRFVPFQPEEQMSAMFADADVLLISQVRAVKDTLIPGKLLTYMAAGRPVLAAVHPESEAAHLLRDAGGGWVVAPEDPAALAAAARRCAATGASVLDGFGRQNRAYAEEHFEEGKILAAHEQWLLHAG